MHIRHINRKPPAWRDPEFPDIDPARGPSWGWPLNFIQAQRGLPSIKNLIKPYEGRPTLRLAWWDKKQKRVRGVEIWGDIVMTPCHWNYLHPEARRLVPHRLLPQEVLGSCLIEPTPARP